MVTNLFAEHADWHGSEQAYREDKLRILALPGVREVVLPARQPELGRRRHDARRGGCSALPTAGTLGRTGISCARRAAARSRGSCRCPGEHNALNLCAALTALEAAGVEVDGPARRR